MSRVCPARALVGTALTFAFACGGAPSQPAGEERAREEVVVASAPAALAEPSTRVSAKPTAERDAVAHLPADCDAAAVLDLARLRTQPAVAKELMPRLEKLFTVASKSAAMERLQVFVKESGLDKRSTNAGTSASVYRFDRAKDFAFFLSKDLIESSFLPRLSEKAAGLFGGIGEVAGMADLSTGKLQLTVQASSADEAKKLDAVATIGKDAALKDARLPKAFGAASALKSLTSRVDGSSVTVEVTFPNSAINEAVQLVAAQLDAASAKLK